MRGRWRYKIGVLLAGLAVVGVATVPADAATPKSKPPVIKPQNDIVRATASTSCNQWDGVASGYYTIYVDRLIDFTPSPDKTRPLYVSVVNHYNHTAQVNQLRYYFNNGSTVQWWTNSGGWVNTAEGSGPTQGAGNTNQYGYSGQLPYDPDVEMGRDGNGNPYGGLHNTISRPASSAGFYDFVNSYSPKYIPWWYDRDADGPVFVLDATIQGVRATCTFLF